MYLYVVVADPIEGLLLEVLSLVPCLEVVHEREHYHHGNTTDAAGLEQGGRENVISPHAKQHTYRPNLSHHLYQPNFLSLPVSLRAIALAAWVSPMAYKRPDEGSWNSRSRSRLIGSRGLR